MKKVFLLSAILLLLTSCTNVKETNLNNIINEAFTTHVATLNTTRKGYRYYLPKGLVLRNSDNYNEVFTSDKYIYYLYVDIVSYHNKTDFNYEKNTNAYYSKSLNINNKLGYIEINNYKNNQYLIEIMYNYAKIEVVGYVDDINTIVAYSLAILNSITYNDNIINNYLSSEEFKGEEEKFDIFEIVGSDNYLQFTEDENPDDSRKDPDYVNQEGAKYGLI